MLLKVKHTSTTEHCRCHHTENSAGFWTAAMCVLKASYVLTVASGNSMKWLCSDYHIPKLIFKQSLFRMSYFPLPRRGKNAAI